MREAVVRDLLSPGSEAIWMAMIRSRNLTSHTYNPSLAHEIAVLIVETYGLELKGLHDEMAERARQR